MRVRVVIAALAALVLLFAAAPAPGARRRRSSRSAGRRTRRRSARSSTRTRRTSGSGRSTTTCWSTSARTTSARRPGIAESWDVSRRQEDRHVPPRRGREVVGRRADHAARTSSTASTCSAATARCSPATPRTSRSVATPDADDRVVKTKKPDARIVGGLFVYILPKHIWGKQSVKALTGTYKPQMPIVGSGPYIVDRVRRATGSSGWSATRTSAATEAEVRRAAVDQVRQRRRRRARAHARRDRRHRRGRSRRPSTRLGKTKNIKTVKSPSPSFTELAFNLCSQRELPGREVQPGGPGPDGAPGDRLRGRPRAHQRDRAPQHGVPRPRAPAQLLQGLLHRARGRPDYPYDPDSAKQMLDDAGWVAGDGGVREKGGQRALVRPATCARSRRRTSRTRGW